MSTYSIGEFEEIVLLTVAILHGKGYTLSLMEEIEGRLQRPVSIGAVQTVLRRLEEKDMVSSEFGEATKVRGGKRKRYFTITTLGQQVLNLIRDQRNALWNDIPQLSIA